MVKTKEQAKMVVFWPNITKEIENNIGSCNTYASMAHNQTRESMIASPIPTYIFEHVGTDIFKFMRIEYLVTAHYCSRFREVEKLTTSRSQQVITKLKAHSARYSIPKTITSDNSPSFHQKSSKIS